MRRSTSESEVVRRRAGALPNSEFVTIPGLQRTVRFAHDTLRPGHEARVYFPAPGMTMPCSSTSALHFATSALM